MNPVPPEPAVSGLRDHQVVARDGDAATVSVAGVHDHPLELAVVDGSGRLVVPWQRVGDGGPWKAVLSVPIGGPYDLVGREPGSATAVGEVLTRDFLVGDVWLLAGQSNMQGVGWLDEATEPPSPHVHVLDMTRRWRLAVEPLHRVFLSPDRAHHLHDDPAELAEAQEAELASPVGAGLGVAFGRAMVEATGVPVGLVATAHGGTSLVAWSEQRRQEGGDSLFGSMLLSVEAAGGRLAGMLWYQGESDALDGLSADYRERIEAFVAAVREETGQPELPFFQVQIGRVVGEGRSEMEVGWSTVREAQRTARLGRGATVTAVDLALSDFIHVSTRSLRRLGRRLAAVASGSATTLTVATVEAHPAARLPGHELLVRFDGVTGSLAPAEGITGFELRGGDGARVTGVYAVEVDRDDPAAVVLRSTVPIDPTWSLWYGHGFDPVCNLVDTSDNAALAFGPWPLGDVVSPAG